jgi:hypothetical protein
MFFVFNFNLTNNLCELICVETEQMFSFCDYHCICFGINY